MSKNGKPNISVSDFKNLELIDYRTIGKRLRKARDDKAISQETLSEYLDLSSTQLSKFETSKAKINLKRLFQICFLLECDIGSILTGTNKHMADYMSPELYSLFKDESPEDINLIINGVKTIRKIDNDNKK